MNSVIVLCVGMMGAAANPTMVEAKHPEPVQVAFAGANFASGGCYGQPAYRPPVVQHQPVNYSPGTANCANGRCAPLGTANCPNGQCQQCGANCSPGATCFGPNCQPRVPGSYYPAAGNARYSPSPGTRLPVPSYSQPRNNPYSAQRTPDWNRTNTYRAVPSNNYQTNNYQSSASPFFN